jgi:signal peptidase I
MFNTIKQLAYALILALLIKYSVIEAYNVPTGSMEDTILIGDFLLANKFIYGIRIPIIGVTLPGIRDPRPGDVVVFKPPHNPSQNYVKRCVAVGGQTVMVRDKQLYIDGEPVEEYPNVKFNRNRRLPEGDNFGPFTVPEGSYFMMGDNRDDSYDSRFWGPVKDELILGQALVIHWSWAQDEDAPAWKWTDPTTLPANLWYNLIHFHDRVRWSRLGSVVD